MPSKLQGKVPVIVINFSTAVSDAGREIQLPKDRCSVPLQVRGPPICRICLAQVMPYIPDGTYYYT